MKERVDSLLRGVWELVVLDWRGQLWLALIFSFVVVFLAIDFLLKTYLGFIYMPGYWVGVLLFPGDVHGGSRLGVVADTTNFLLIGVLSFLVLRFLTRGARNMK